jgi:lysophospholipase L1-like esterase
MRALPLFVGLAVAGIGATPLRAAETARQCNAPQELYEDDTKFSALAESFAKKQPVVIVAIGGASTAGPAEGESYPHFLEAALRQRHPGASITVINRGIRGQTTEQMADRFAKDVYPSKPNLVVWETGTVDAVRNEDVGAMASALSDGLAALESHGAEVMLMDMQYNPSTVSVINFEPYLAALHQAAELQDVYMFKRFDLMKYWSDAGTFDFINVPKEQRAVLAREFYECLGERLADAIDRAAH